MKQAQPVDDQGQSTQQQPGGASGIIHLTLQHQGVGLVADFAARAALESGALVPVLPQWSLTGNYAPRTAYAVYAPSRHLPLKVRALIDHLIEAGKRG